MNILEYYNNEKLFKEVKDIAMFAIAEGEKQLGKCTLGVITTGEVTKEITPPFYYLFFTIHLVFPNSLSLFEENIPPEVSGKDAFEDAFNALVEKKQRFKNFKKSLIQTIYSTHRGFYEIVMYDNIEQVPLHYKHVLCDNEEDYISTYLPYSKLHWILPKEYQKFN